MLAFGGAVLAASSFGTAALIAPGVNTFSLPEPGPVGATLVATLTVPLTTPTYTGTLTSEVFSGDVSNPLGGLTFTYKIANDPSSAHAITRLAVNGFSGTLTDMSFLAGSGMFNPTLNDRDSTSNVVGFTYIGAPIGGGTIAPGSNTSLMVVQTNAAAFKRTIAITIDGSIATVDSFSPLVPEPASASALLVTAGLLRRRR